MSLTQSLLTSSPPHSNIPTLFQSPPLSPTCSTALDLLALTHFPTSRVREVGMTVRKQGRYCQGRGSDHKQQHCVSCNPIHISPGISHIDHNWTYWTDLPRIGLLNTHSSTYCPICCIAPACSCFTPPLEAHISPFLPPGWNSLLLAQSAWWLHEVFHTVKTVSKHLQTQAGLACCLK